MQYAYALGSLGLLILWLVVHRSLREPLARHKMWVVSLWTLPLGLTEPLFVPDYWSPPSLFDLADLTRFDLESLLFSFSVGGIAAVAYDAFRPARHGWMSHHERSGRRHRFHAAALVAGPAAFALLYAATSLNPIYAATLGLLAGGLAAAACRPDLTLPMLLGAVLFASIYFVFFAGLLLVFPGWVDLAWNVEVLTGVRVAGVPIEEILFAFALGLLWSSLYEHVSWLRYDSSRGPMRG